jgi:methionyl-tRNA formyltransferase
MFTHHFCRGKKPQTTNVMIRSSFVSFRGPAPLQHTILSGADKTGVTLQTLDDKSFDHGIILSQSPLLSIPNQNHCTYEDLLDFISPKAASILVQGLRDRVFIPPLVDVGPSTAKSVYPQEYQNQKHATKITPGDRELHLHDWDADQIYRHYRAVGRLWSKVWIDTKMTKRLIFEDIILVDRPKLISNWIEHWKSKHPKTYTRKKQEEMDSAATRFMVASKETNTLRPPILYIEDGDAIVFNTKSCAVRIGSITIEGQGKKAASKALRSIQRKSVWRLISVPEKVEEQAYRWLLVEPVEADEIEVTIGRIPSPGIPNDGRA